MIPLPIVEKESFRTLFEGNTATKINGKEIGGKICDKKKRLGEKNLENVKYICTTADVWSAKRRGFVGVIAQ